MRDFLRLKKFAGPSRLKQERAGRGHLIAVAIAALVVVFATSPTQVQAQSRQTGSAIVTAGPAGDDATTRYESASKDVHAAMDREIARMDAEMKMVEWFIVRLDYLRAVARADPEDAMRQRLPMAMCRASLLASICDDLPVLFAPEPDQP